jgi:hypothetical protein
MPLLGQAAMLLSFDVAAEAIAEHDAWHTHEHLPERLAIPGFLRGSRWVALAGQPRYFVMYEVATLGTLTSAAYRERLNNPTPWTSKMMAHYRNMRRAFCTVTGSFGHGIGYAGLLIRFKPVASAEAPMRTWLTTELLPQLPAQAGIGSMHLLESAVMPEMTNEQRIRGADAGLDWVLFATGYDVDRLGDLKRTHLGVQRLSEQGVPDVQTTTYRIHYSLSHGEVTASPR